MTTHDERQKPGNTMPGTHVTDSTVVYNGKCEAEEACPADHPHEEAVMLMKKLVTQYILAQIITPQVKTV